MLAWALSHNEGLQVDFGIRSSRLAQGTEAFVVTATQSRHVSQTRTENTAGKASDPVNSLRDHGV